MKNKLIIIILLFTSCQNIQYRLIFFKWHNKKIIIPNDFNNNIFNSIDSLTSINYRLINIIDGSCSFCVGELKSWENIANELPAHIKVIIVIHSANYYYLDDYLNNIPMLFYIDDENFFLTKNKLPENIFFHTLLINNENKVKLIGNPIKSKEIKELLFEIAQQ